MSTYEAYRMTYSLSGKLKIMFLFFLFLNQCFHIKNVLSQKTIQIKDSAKRKQKTKKLLRQI